MLFALSTSNAIFLGFLVLTFFVLAYSYYTRRGSAIDQRPHDGRDDAPGARGSSHISTTDPDVESTISSRGTR
jgi:hypothetical protein